MEKIKKRNHINWEVVNNLLVEKGLSKAYVSNMMGFSNSWISNYSRENRTINFAQLSQLAMILGVDKETLIMAETVSEKTISQEPESGFEPSQFEIDVLEMLKAIKQKVDADHEILMYLFNQKQSKPSEDEKEEPIDELETSISVLKEILENRTAVKLETFKEEVMKKGVSDIQMIEAAISKLGHHKTTRGYGNNKTVWIYRQGDANA